MSEKQPMEIAEKKKSVKDVFNAIEEELTPLESIHSIAMSIEKVNDLLQELDELIDNEIVIPTIKCPACINRAGIAKGCPVCQQTGLIYHPQAAD